MFAGSLDSSCRLSVIFTVSCGSLCKIILSCSNYIYILISQVITALTVNKGVVVPP